MLRQNGFTYWPPRLPEQPIFYPVTNEQQAEGAKLDAATAANLRELEYG